jgi:hypothetical protein
VTAQVAISALRMISASSQIAAGKATAAETPGLFVRAFAVAEAGCPRPLP